MTIKANNAWNKKPVYFNAVGWSGDLGMGSHGLCDDVMKTCSGVSICPLPYQESYFILQGNLLMDSKYQNPKSQVSSQGEEGGEALA